MELSCLFRNTLSAIVEATSRSRSNKEFSAQNFALMESTNQISQVIFLGSVTCQFQRRSKFYAEISLQGRLQVFVSVTTVHKLALTQQLMAVLFPIVADDLYPIQWNATQAPCNVNISPNGTAFCQTILPRANTRLFDHLKLFHFLPRQLSAFIYPPPPPMVDHIPYYVKAKQKLIGVAVLRGLVQ